MTRISDSLIYSRTVLAVQPVENRPVLEVALHGGGGARTISRYALEALGRLRHGLLHSQGHREPLAGRTENARQCHRAEAGKAGQTKTYVPP